MKSKKRLVLKTWNEWESEGYHVIKGQKAIAYNGKSQALFAVHQVTKTIHYSHAPDVTRFDYAREYIEKEPETVYYADGSGYVNYGGPCGPLYFDRNGNT